MPKEIIKQKTYSEVLADLRKNHSVPIGSFNDVVAPTLGLSSGNIGIDYVTDVGGLPQRRMTELYGLPSSGKTTTALQSAARLQKKIIAESSDDVILYLDFEHALDLDYAGELGLNLEHPSFLLAQPNWLEQGAEIGLSLIATGVIRMSIWDSIAAMTPKDLIDGAFDQRTAAMNRARLMSGLCQRLVPLLYEHNCSAVMINHLMEAVEMTGRPGMPPKATTPGGKGVKYYSSLRLEYRQMGNIKGKGFDQLSGQTVDRTVATKVKVKCVKNKVGSPFREVEVMSRFGEGFDNFWSALQVMVAHKQIVTTGAYFYFDALKVAHLIHEHMELSATKRAYVHGENNLLAFADAHPDWRQEFIDTAMSLLDAYGTTSLDAREQPGAIGDLGPDLELDEA